MITKTHLAVLVSILAALAAGAVAYAQPTVFQTVMSSGGGDPCSSAPKTPTPININTATSKILVPAQLNKRTYICSMVLLAAGADNVGLVEGAAGTNCATVTAGVFGGPTAAQGAVLTPGVPGFVLGNGAATVMETAGANVDFCAITSAAQQLSGHMTWVQAP
jgi:hypothetical protein